MAINMAYAENVIRTLLAQGTEQEVRDALVDVRDKIAQEEAAKAAIPSLPLSAAGQKLIFDYLDIAKPSGDMRAACAAAKQAQENRDWPRFVRALLDFFVEARVKL